MPSVMSLNRRQMLLTAGVVVVGAAVGSGYALWPRWREESGRYFAVDGVALRGYDPVAYFTEGKPVAGSPDHAVTWSGVTWRFASAANRDAFAADPKRYAPQYGGFCAWAVATKKQAFATDPDAWRIVGGKLYLNYNADIQRKWVEDIPGFISTADTNWPELHQRLVEKAAQ